MEEEMQEVEELITAAAMKCQAYISVEIKYASHYVRGEIKKTKVYSIYCGKDEVIKRNTIFFKDMGEVKDGLNLLIKDGYIAT